MELLLFLPYPEDALALPLGKDSNYFILLALPSPLTIPWLKCSPRVLSWERHWLNA